MLLVPSLLVWIGVQATPPLVTVNVTPLVSALSRAESPAIMTSPTTTPVVGRLITRAVAPVLAWAEVTLRSVIADCAVAGESAV